MRRKHPIANLCINLTAYAFVGFVFLFGIFLAVSYNGSYFVLEFPFYILAGWGFFIQRVGPQIAISWAGMVTGMICLIVFAAGLHRFLGWLQAQRGSGSASADRVWPKRRTICLVALVVLLFVTGIAATGITHQTAWLLSDPQPVLRNREAEAVFRPYTAPTAPVPTPETTAPRSK